MSWPLHRGQVVRANINLDEPKLFVVVSNNRRNAVLPQVLAARLTTSPKPAIPSVVELQEPKLNGRVVCDDITELYEDEIIGVVTALSPRTMQSINNGLKAALDLP